MLHLQGFLRFALLVSLAAFAVGNEELHRERRQATKAPACEKLNFEKTLKTCCKWEFAAPFSTDHLQKCTKDKNVHKFANAYMLSGAVSKAAPNDFCIIIITVYSVDIPLPFGLSIHLFDITTVEVICFRFHAKALALGECLFKNIGLMAENQVDFEKTIKYYQSTQKTDSWNPVISASLEALKSALEKLSPDQITVTIPAVKKGETDQKANIVPLLVMQSVQAALIKTCPEPIPNTKGNKCNATITSFNYCTSEKALDQAKKSAKVKVTILSDQEQVRDYLAKHP